MIRLKDLLTEISNSKAPYGVLVLDTDKILVGDNHMDPMPLSKDLQDTILNVAKQYGYYGEGIGIKYNKAVSRSDIYTALKNSEARHMGSWDDKIEIPDTEKYTYVATLFDNPTENDTVEKIMNTVKGKDTIFNVLVKTFDLWGQPGIGLTAADLKRFLNEMSEKGIDFYKWAQKTITQPELQSFIDAGDKLMWPDNWQEYPNKAGKLARRGTLIRDNWLIQKAPKGIYFIGDGHLLDISKMTGKKVIDGHLIDVEK
jgi:hypothetical protein